MGRVPRVAPYPPVATVVVVFVLVIVVEVSFGDFRCGGGGCVAAAAKTAGDCGTGCSCMDCVTMEAVMTSHVRAVN